MHNPLFAAWLLEVRLVFGEFSVSFQ